MMMFLLIGLFLCGQQAPPPPGPVAFGQPLPVDPKVETILDAVEKSGANVRSIRCRIEYLEQDEVNLSETKKTGEVRFLKAEPNPFFMIMFDRFEEEGRAARDQKRLWYLLKDRSLFEARERTRHVIEREVMAPGERIDLFNLEKAPFPMPFGQKKEQILRHFDVRLEPARPSDPKNADHLVCTPRPNSRLAESYSRLDFYVLRDVHLPCRIVARERGGYLTTRADFLGLADGAINSGLSRKDFEEPADWRGYTRDLEPLKRPGPGG